MYKEMKPFFLIVETPLHVGSGTELGLVDLPIQREKHTSFPKIEGSSIKGTIRCAFGELGKEIQIGDKKISVNDQAVTSYIFGPEEGDIQAGKLGFTDARILLFPVKSIKGVFAWITCPRVLERFKRELTLAGIENLPEIPEESTIPENSSLIIQKSDNDKKCKIVLEEYTFDVEEEEKCNEYANWLSKNIFGTDGNYNYWRNKMQRDIVFLSDDDFKDFVNMFTETITRTKIDPETGTVQEGGLFTEEYLPSETILYSIALISAFPKIDKNSENVFNQENKSVEDLVMEYFIQGLPEVLQMGGNATLGKGIVRTRIIGDEIAGQ